MCTDSIQITINVNSFSNYAHDYLTYCPYYYTSHSGCHMSERCNSQWQEMTGIQINRGRCQQRGICGVMSTSSAELRRWGWDLLRTSWCLLSFSLPEADELCNLITTGRKDFLWRYIMHRGRISLGATSTFWSVRVLVHDAVQLVQHPPPWLTLTTT